MPFWRKKNQYRIDLYCRRGVKNVGMERKRDKRHRGGEWERGRGRMQRSIHVEKDSLTLTPCTIFINIIRELNLGNKKW